VPVGPPGIPSPLVELIAITRSAMAQTPHTSCDRRCLVWSQLSATHRRHWAAVLFWLRYAISYRLLDSGIATIAPEPLFASEIWSHGRALTTCTMTARTRGSGHLAVEDAVAQRNHFPRCAFRNRDRQVGGGTGVW